jgi:TPR repeat protein
MAEKKHESSGFTVTDKRLFTSDGDLRVESPETEAPQPAPLVEPAASTANADVSPINAGDANALHDMPPPPTAAEQDAQAAAYRQSSKEVDSQVELSGRSAKEFEVNFERFLASLYMTAMMQLGLMHEQSGQPRIDIIGARQTIDTLSLLSEKTKGNLSSAEEGFLQNSLYELRMAYVEVTNALARPPQAGHATGTSGR